MCVWEFKGMIVDALKGQVISVFWCEMKRDCVSGYEVRLPAMHPGGRYLHKSMLYKKNVCKIC